MQSGEGNQSTTQSITAKQVADLALKPIGALTSTDLLHGLDRGGDKPLDFIKKNLAEINPDTTASVNTKAVFDKVTNDRAITEAAEKIVATAKAIESEKEPAPVFGEKPTTGEPNDKPEVQTESATPPPEEDPLAEIPDDPAAENFKKLRTKTKETVKALKETQSEKERLAKRVEEYETGKVIPEVLKEKEAEIERLKPFESIVNLKSSRAYQEKFVKPLTDTTTKLKQLFTDYNVPAEFIEQLIDADKESDVNKFLSENFDVVGAQDIKNLVRSAKALKTEATAAEAKPTEALSRIEAEGKAAHEARDVQRKAQIFSTATDTWGETLSEIRSEGKVLELIRRPSDPEFNKNVVDPILTQASLDYQKFVMDFTKLGIGELPKDMAKALAKMALLAHTAGTAIHTRNGLANHAEELENNTKRMHNVLRPPIGGGTVGSSRGGGAPERPTTAKEDATALINSVLAKKQK